jgi:hypothetical protein
MITPHLLASFLTGVATLTTIAPGAPSDPGGLMVAFGWSEASYRCLSLR